VRCSGSRASNKLGHALTDAAEATELVSLKTNVKTSAFRQTLKIREKGEEILRDVLVRFT
jgi:hypothetical protein